jgi:hypothetical protein
MGRQFSFFLGPDDLTRFEATLRSKGDVAFLADRPNQTNAIEIPQLARNTFRTLLARPEDCAAIKFMPVYNQEFFSADCFANNFIECDVVSTPRDRFLTEGRLYYHATFWNAQNERVEKSVEFVKWADSLFRRTKKSLTYVEKWFYAGEHALQLRKEGVKFNQLDGWAG